MATKSEIQVALAAARAAGAQEDVAALEAALREGGSPALKAGVQSGMQAATANFSDEILGAMRALGPGRSEVGSLGERFRAGRDRERTDLAASRSAHPTASLVGDVAGTVAGAALLPAGAGAARGATLATRALRAVPAGAGLGAAHGAGSAEELEDVPGGALRGGAVGALAGGMGEAGASAARLAGRGIRHGLAVKARIGGKLADAAGMPGAARYAERAERALLPSPSLSSSKARALTRRAEKEGGFTFDPRTGESPTSGFAFSADPNNERVLQKLSPRSLRDYAGETGSALKDPTARLGGWKGDDGWYLDVSRVLPDKKVAMREARDAGQKAVYDLGRGKEIKTPFPTKKGEAARASALARRRRGRKLTTPRTALAVEATDEP